MSRREEAFYDNAEMDFRVRNLKFADGTVQATAPAAGGGGDSPLYDSRLTFAQGAALGAVTVYPLCLSTGMDVSPKSPAVTAVADTWYCQQVYFKIGDTIDRLGVNTASTSAAVDGRVMLYDSVGNYPTNLLAESGVLDISSAGFVTSMNVLGTPLVIPATGIYWGVVVYDTNVAMGGWDTEHQWINIGFTSTSGSATFDGISAAQAFGAAPDPFFAGAQGRNLSPYPVGFFGLSAKG